MSFITAVNFTPIILFSPPGGLPIQRSGPTPRSL